MNKDIAEQLAEVNVFLTWSGEWLGFAITAAVRSGRRAGVVLIPLKEAREAARMVEEGVATAEDMDKATRYGFGFRFAILGLLEFIDWGGGDILFHASNYMTKATGEDRFAAPQIVKDNMAQGRNGLRDGQGFLDYENMDVPAYQSERLAAFVAMLGHLGKMPTKG